MSVDERVACAVNGIVGGVAGAGIFFSGLGWMDFWDRNSMAWWIGFLMCTLLGGLVGVVSYFQRHQEMEFNFVGVYSGAEGGVLLAKRVGVLLFASVAVYFLWQLARGI